MGLEYKEIGYALKDKVATVTIRRPHVHNAYTLETLREWRDAYTKRPRDYWKYMVVFQEAVDALRDCGKPTIARVNGVCAGGGNELHMACDLSVAADDVDFLQVGTKVGSVAAGGGAPGLPFLIA